MGDSIQNNRAKIRGPQRFPGSSVYLFSVLLHVYLLRFWEQGVVPGDDGGVTKSVREKERRIFHEVGEEFRTEGVNGEKVGMSTLTLLVPRFSRNPIDENWYKQTI